jgi:hypothetical protein
MVLFLVSWILYHKDLTEVKEGIHYTPKRAPNPRGEGWERKPQSATPSRHETEGHLAAEIKSKRKHTKKQTREKGGGGATSAPIRGGVARHVGREARKGLRGDERVAGAQGIFDHAQKGGSAPESGESGQPSPNMVNHMHSGRSNHPPPAPFRN